VNGTTSNKDRLGGTIRLGEFLIRRRAISPRQLWQALLVQQRSSPSELEVIDTLLGPDDDDTRAQILAHAAQRDCDFLTAAEELGIRPAEEIRRATTSVYKRRPHLGQILVSLSFVTKEAMTAHLAEFAETTGQDLPQLD